MPLLLWLTGNQADRAIGNHILVVNPKVEANNIAVGNNPIGAWYTVHYFVVKRNTNHIRKSVIPQKWRADTVGLNLGSGDVS